ncbi:hypothetical protein L208DRAFT_160034 [Tricholoma matsutake]|nr:hypothetical protein L208DRAFT_160034 [Tricholoma matsutake 945]
MSRRRSTSSSKASVPDRDVVMGPPPAPAPSAAVPQTNQDISEKYRKLKRRFFELEEETNTELQRSGERNVKMREERNILLDRIIELENEYSLKSNGRSSLSPPLSSALAQPGSSALPRTLLGARARASFVANLREAVDDPDDDADPILTSRHVGPEARRRYEEESRERFDQESREPRRSARRTRSSLTQVATSSHKDQEPNISVKVVLHNITRPDRVRPPQ